MSHTFDPNFFVPYYPSSQEGGQQPHLPPPSHSSPPPPPPPPPGRDEEGGDDSSSLSAPPFIEEGVNWPPCVPCAFVLSNGDSDDHRCRRQASARAKRCQHCRDAKFICDSIEETCDPAALPLAEQLGPALHRFITDPTDENQYAYEEVAGQLRDFLPAKPRRRATSAPAPAPAPAAISEETAAALVEHLRSIAHSLERLSNTGISVRIVSDNGSDEEGGHMEED
ncbi:uncharacterized protein F4807DRAFT_466078 [Annulohypoxylon truncatum]|uniref:uncharacterized protein n=1 Tax=Annulohypoxylon truncatum TaxID=327061 RepID=UPI002007CBC9|nr:uncharacterized protein F4807DRAFT_466078 [Annulohypoxylon truncatum]KAI1204053.1 hypothetical protein F4807DRAFT_466078 [Annulohypoxylon truncatum]